MTVPSGTCPHYFPLQFLVLLSKPSQALVAYSSVGWLCSAGRFAPMFLQPDGSGSWSHLKPHLGWTSEIGIFSLTCLHFSWNGQRLSLSLPLSPLPLSAISSGSLTARWVASLRRASLRQEAEAVHLLQPVLGNWHSITSALFCWSVPEPTQIKG